MLAAAETNLRQRRNADIDLLRIAAGWADLHNQTGCRPTATAIWDAARRPQDQQGTAIDLFHPVRFTIDLASSHA